MSMVVYPSRAGMDAWEELGNPGWGWDGISPYIRKSQTVTPPSDAIREFFKGMKHDSKDHGSDGPFQVSFGDEYMPYQAAWMKTFKALGYPQIEDPANGAGLGPFVTPGSIDPATHSRSHSAAAYLGPEVQARSNLRVVTGALVQKLILEKQTDGILATGVNILKDQQEYTIKATREVILAAGATQTPQILELSGIGDTNILQSHGIETVLDSPGVGENLQDHGMVTFPYEVADGLPSGDMVRDPEIFAAAMAAWQKDGSGPLGRSPFISAFMPCLDYTKAEHEDFLQQVKELIRSPSTPQTHKKQFEALYNVLRNPSEPSAQYMLAPFQMPPIEGDDMKSLLGMPHPGLYISLVSVLSYPLSRGSVHIRSADPQAAPLIDHGILRQPLDLEKLARHCMWIEKFADTEPMASLLKKGGRRLHTPEPLTDLEKAKEACKRMALSVYHVSGTCAMMAREDGGVVDSQLKVYGTSNVRVVDASIFPLEPRGNIQVTVYAVAEKAADIIKSNIEQ